MHGWWIAKKRKMQACSALERASIDGAQTTDVRPWTNVAFNHRET